MVRDKYWKARGVAEGTAEMESGRELFFKAEKARTEGKYAMDPSDPTKEKGALEYFEEAFPKWRAVLTKPEFASLRDDQPIVEDAQTYEPTYLKLPSRLSKPIPSKR